MTKVIRSENAAGKNWYHLSTRSDNKVVRQLTKDGLVASSDKPHSWDIALRKSQVAQLVGRFPRIGESDDWIKLLKILERGEFESKLTAEKNTVFVPRTRLRSFRFAFRDWTMGLKRAQADFFANNVDCLRELWNLSITEIEKYTYQESFHNRTNCILSSEPKALSDIQNTVDAATYFKSHFTSPAQMCRNTFQYLDREIAPLRTRNAHFVGGAAATSSGSGGMDLLLLSGERVCAGEVKVGEDSELFEALLQGMWYGSELATRKQITRVATHYSKDNVEEEKVDVAIFSINQERDKTREATIKLVKEITDKGGFKNLGSVYLFENNSDKWNSIT